MNIKYIFIILYAYKDSWISKAKIVTMNFEGIMLIKVELITKITHNIS